MLERLFCFLNFHSWSAYAHIPRRCVDERFCKNCTQTENYDAHRFGKWISSVQETNSWINGELKTIGQFSIQKRLCLDCNFQEVTRSHA